MVEISVIIPTLNEEKYLATPLKALKKQSFKDFEVIVADGGSKDRTRQIAKRFDSKLIYVKKRGISSGRNAGARIAKGKILVFLDADTMPFPDLLKQYRDAIQDGVIAATGPLLELEKVPMRMRIGYKLVSVLTVRLSIALGKPSIIGSNFAVKKSAFDKIHGFNEGLMTYEDWDLSHRLGEYGKIAYVNGAKVRVSARRVIAWGMRKYFMYHVGNVIRYSLTKEPKTDYPEVR
ncbi:MAG: glycosyltransferase [Candidatus Marsarchaeota archaeon]|nr:glycosyltransferase [Candidatus Marsarchaeota archaeon]